MRKAVYITIFGVIVVGLTRQEAADILRHYDVNYRKGEPS